ncbi:MAG TPA: protein-methionine-sulfoxide reductase heme-binding subunit MsrQ [Burkholderiales bacterium]|nr:protein-methionine-sulfoxide reductase heme-binding subunit MsrQ [Burkholderiales bacterium]
MKQPTQQQVKAIKAALFIAGLVPLALLALRAFEGRLGANPIEYITRSTGWWTLTFLLITLLVTPLRRLTSLNWLLRLRRMLGLFAFFYVCLHFTTYIWLDQFFDWPAIVKDVIKRPFITIGFAAFLLLIPLAATSTNSMVKRLGAKRWQALHRLIYLIGALGVVHFWWLVKKDIREPLLFALVLAVLLGARLVWRASGATKPSRPTPAAARSASTS